MRVRQRSQRENYTHIYEAGREREEKRDRCHILKEVIEGEVV